MYLSKLTLDTGHALVRRDLGDAYDMHRTLTRAFTADAETPPPRFLWRLERRPHDSPHAVVLVQSATAADWSILDARVGYAIEVQGNKRVNLESLIEAGRTYRFRLLANPTVTRAGKRYGLFREEEQLAWLARQGERHGFALASCLRGDCERLRARHGKAGPPITLDIALFDGVLEAVEPDRLRPALLDGFGPGKAFGLGMLSVGRLGCAR